MRPGNHHVVLVGMMGAGKTTVGRLLAERLGWEFWDNDVALAEATGKTAAEVQKAEGLAALHRLEDRLLRDALATRTSTVFAAAASVVLDPEVVRGELTVWLHASAGTGADNVARSGQRHRPLPGAPTAVLRRLATRREPLYAALADITVEVGADPATTCDLVVAALAETVGIQPSAGPKRRRPD